MEPSFRHELQRPSPNAKKPERTSSYLLSFLWMILFTTASFVIVGGQWFESSLTFWIITVLAVIQVILQVFTFMHLNRKGSGVIILFFGFGALIAVVSAIGIVLMP